jgi:hypothetical protein
MMDRGMTRGLATLGLLMASILAAPTVSAKNFALACVSSATGDTIYFEYRWGNDDWEAVTAEPDQWQMLMWHYNYRNENRSPQLQVRYDDDMSGREHYVITDLEAYAANDENCEGEGKTYHFHDRGSELFLVEDDE